jgi:hypothetical protein
MKGTKNIHPLVRYEPRFIEEAIFLALRSHPEAGKFHKERNRLYEMADPEEREHAFQNLHQAWFPRLGLANAIEKALEEQPLITANLATCLVACAPGKRQEGADLLVRDGEGLSEKERCTLRLLIRPESLLDPLALMTFLRHELFHISDMLDPHFGYEPQLPAAEAGPTHDRMLQDRYCALWDTTIDGRMVRRGWAPESIRSERFYDFARAFPMFGDEAAPMFSRFFDHESHTHGELVTMAREPRSAIGGPWDTPQPGSRCPLCNFPTYEFTQNPESLPKETIREITQDFPEWVPSRGLCYQCAELYRARTRAWVVPINLGRTHPW